MVGLGIGIFFSGYWLLAYGWSQIHGANASLIQLGWPGSYKGPSLDVGTAPSTPAVLGSGSLPTTPNAPGTPSTATPAQAKNSIQNHVGK
jgi:hypothetical protein